MLRGTFFSWYSQVDAATYPRGFGISNAASFVSGHPPCKLTGSVYLSGTLSGKSGVDSPPVVTPLRSGRHYRGLVYHSFTVRLIHYLRTRTIA